MSSRTDVTVAVLAHATSQRRLAHALQAAASAQRVPVELRTMAELATETSVLQEPGRAAVVQPDRPMLWLAVGDPPADDADERFAQAEVYAAARSVAILTASPVLNRPTPFGSQGSLPMGAVTALRGVPQQWREQVRTERFASRSSAVQRESQEVLDYATGSRSFGAPHGEGPFRVRAAEGRNAWFTVAGARTFGPDVAGLHDASREVAASYGLGLANVWWTCPPDATPVLARVDAWAWDSALGRRLADVATALVEWFSDCVGERS